MHDPAFYRQLVQRYVDNQASDNELLVFFYLLEKGELTAYLDEAMEQAGKMMAVPQRPAGQFQRWSVPMRIAVAAIFLLVVVASYFTFFAPTNHPDTDPITQTSRQQPDIAPASHQARLTLGDGQVLVLNGSPNGHLADQGSASVIKESDGLLTYQGMADSRASVVRNKVSTPRGGYYQVVLPDGTKAWLNAASAIEFPTAFTGTDRSIAVSGEVYLEVAKDAARPFKVDAGNGVIEVLGTHFNVNAYADEPALEVTLLEGAVQVTSGVSKATLRPGQQARITGPQIQVNQHANTEQAIAWKNGAFQFSDETIESVMRQLSRWYDVEVVYAGQPPTRHFGGIINRNTHLSEVLKVLALSGVRCSLQEKKIIVYP